MVEGNASASDVTKLLNLINHGAPGAWDRLMSVVYDELKKLAVAKMARESPGQTLQATALVNEAFLRLVGGPNPSNWENRRHFFGAASEAMRRVLVDAARRRLAEKRGGGERRPTLNLDEVADLDASEELIALSEALEKLSQVRPQAAEIVKLRYFAGLTGHQAAECIGISPRTADNYWSYAKAFLFNEIDPK